MNEFQTLCETFGLDAETIPESFRRHYEASKETGRGKRIERSTIEKALAFYDLTETDYQAACFACAERINGDEALKELFDLLSYVLNDVAGDDCYRDMTKLKKQTKRLFAQPGLASFPYLMLLNEVDHHQSKMKELDFDEEQIKRHIRGVHNSCLKQGLLTWGALFTNVRILSVGRLQYEILSWEKDYSIYINSETNEVKTEKESDSDRLACQKGDYYITIHIPASGKFDAESVQASIRDSREQILKYFKGKIPVPFIYACYSWMISPDLRDILNPESNLIKFLDLFRVVERKANVSGFLTFVFKAADCKDYSTLPEDSSLQRALKKYLVEGRPLHQGVGVVKPTGDYCKFE